MKDNIQRKSINFKEVENEWKKMIKGQQINENMVSPIIHKSWQKSIKKSVDPYSLGETLVMTTEEVRGLSDSKEMEKEYGDIIKVIKEIVVEMDLTFMVFDEKARVKKIIACPDNVYGGINNENILLKNAAEDQLGTNAVCLALNENKPVQVLGPEHFNYYLHKANCSAAPIHSPTGKVIGAINISSYNTKQTAVTLGLVASIAKILDNNLLVNYMLDKLSICKFTLNEIMEYLPNGMVYINHRNEIANYNQKLLDLLNIDKNGTDKVIQEEIQKCFSQLSFLQAEKELEHKEVLLKINNRKKSYLISTKKILNSNNKEKGSLIMFQDTNKILKLQNTLRGNKAVYTFENIIGTNHQIQKIKAVAKKIAKSSSAVLIYGESGTGKEVFAQAIHNASFRKDKPFVAINCGAIPSELIESELFGYDPGAFTGALKGGKLGKLELASGGTLFLDEVESMPLNVQIKLLRTLSTSKITRIGGLDDIPIDIRLISATKKDLLKESENGSFREDLYFRINIITLNLPPLRERKDDIPQLTKYFVDMFSKPFGLPEIKIDEKFLEALSYYYWRGNVRELQNVIERSILLLNNESVLTINNLPTKIVNAYKYKSLKTEVNCMLNKTNNNHNLLKVGEEIIIERVIKEENGNLTKAAKRLGISRPTLYKKIGKSKKLKNVNNLYNA